jgi:hypothetical protein
MEADREAFLVETHKSFWLRHRGAEWLVGGVLLVLVVAVVAIEIVVHRTEPFLRARIVEALESNFHSHVELDRFHVSLVKGLSAEGGGLRIWAPSRAGGAADEAQATQPMIRLAEFRFHAPLRWNPGKPIHISVIELKGLHIDLPPRSRFQGVSEKSVDGQHAQKLVSFDIASIDCTDSDLVLETDKPGKVPLEFAIAHLKLTGVSSGGALGFEAELANPRPKGAIHTMGTFGPVQTPDIGASPVRGDYQFNNADLGDFKGIAGTLSSTGHYEGTLRDLTVDGETETPNFRLTHFGNAMSLATHFHAHVDGTNGDTRLEPVDAILGNSHFTAQGQIVRVPGPVIDGRQRSRGHDIALKVNVNKARIEDFLHLTSGSDKLILTGDIKVKASLHISPGPEEVHKRLGLDGSFALDHARFTSTKIQGRIAELSLRGEGRPSEVKSTDPTTIFSQMQSNFKVANGIVTLPGLTYSVPGASIQVSGTYGIEGGKLNFAGTAKLDATVSKAVGGWKGFLLTPANRFFKKDGAGTEVAIHVEGTRDDPSFGIDLNRGRIAGQTHPQSPAEPPTPQPEDGHLATPPAAQ